MDSAAHASKQDNIINEVKKLRPEIFFKEILYIQNADVIKYEAIMRKTIEQTDGIAIISYIL